MLNVVAIMGRLARDPELRQTTTGKNVASFRIACDRGRRDANGQSQADWIDVVAWDRQAEFVCKYFHKGQLAAVQGSIQTRSYTDKDGNKRKAFEIVAESVHFAESKKDKSNEPIVTIPGNDAFEEIISDDDLPFNQPTERR